ncbi:hypothetical protein ES332_D02G090200v1 [Gossypium tomentosum]|uniref:Uncharacterized protein n=1 Tax=Gossypium tomentosum TaxID=34277 RepID=A0A5D2LUZ4_GOSTO|nr:hypothetical protein ES332_D02G090200v1 [Gossypium tomentosum]
MRRSGIIWIQSKPLFNSSFSLKHLCSKPIFNTSEYEAIFDTYSDMNSSHTFSDKM